MPAIEDYAARVGTLGSAVCDGQALHAIRAADPEGFEDYARQRLQLEPWQTTALISAAVRAGQIHPATDPPPWDPMPVLPDPNRSLYRNPDGSLTVLPAAWTARNHGPFGQAVDSAGTPLTDDAITINYALGLASHVRLIDAAYNIASTITLATAGQSLTGAASAPGKNIPGVMATTMFLAAAANCDMIDITAGNCHVADIELNGNGANQTGGTAVIQVKSGGLWSMIQRCSVHHGFGFGIDSVGAQAVKILDCGVQQNGSAGVVFNSSATDGTVRGTLVGSNTGDGISTSGSVTHILDCDIYSNGGNGVKVNSGADGTMISNCGVDRNTQAGVVILSGDVSVVGCTLHSNGQGATNTYGSVTVDNTGAATPGVTIYANTFWLDSGITNKPSHHILYKNTANTTTKAAGNQFQAASYVTATISAASQAADANETA